MKMYEVCNGFMGYSYVRVYVLAENKEQALELAKETFEKDKEGNPEGWSHRLEALLICEDASKPWCSEVLD